jgi:hypothetical protein
MTIAEPPVPDLLRDAIRDGRWPKGRIRGVALSPLSPLLADTDLELLPSLEERAPGRSLGADTGTLHGFAENETLAAKYRLKRGSADSDPIELPWLDVGQALAIGGGADCGDDTWLVLDFRTSRSDPRAVVNAWQPGRPPQSEWRELASSLSEFLQVLGAAEASR